MSNALIFVLIFAVILVIVGWISAEYMSHNSGKKNKKYVQKIGTLEREKDYLNTQLSTETTKLGKARDELNTLREAKNQIRVLEREHEKLIAEHKKTIAGISIIRDRVSHKRYGSNALAKDIVQLLREHCPTEEQRLEMESEETQTAFKRIKNTIGEAEI